MATGRLDVLLGLDAAQFITGLNRSTREAEKFQQSMLGLGKKVGAALGGALSAGAFVSMVKGAIDAADKLNDLSKQTGVAVETLGGLGFAASQAGGNLETTVEGLGKLNKTIAEAASGNEKALEFFQKLGIDVRDSTKQIKDAGTVYVEIAGKFEQLEDGPNKAALALRGFGKSGQEQIKVLNEGGEALRKNIDYYQKFSGVTAETARQADEFNDTMGKLSLLASALGRKIAIELLPFLQVLGTEFQKVGEDGQTAFDTIAGGFSNFFRNFAIIAINVKSVLSAMGKDISERAAQLKAFFSGDFAKAGEIAAGLSISSFAKRLKAALDESAGLSREIANAVPQKAVRGIGLEDLDAALRRTTKKPAPGLRDSGSASNAAQLAKRQLDSQLSALDNFIKNEERLLDARNSSLDRLYDQDRISIADYFAGKNEALDRNTAETAAAFNEQIRLYSEFASRATEETDKLDALTKLADVSQKRTDFLSKQSDAATKLADARILATNAYKDSVTELNAKLLELIGTEQAAADAARLRAGIANRSLRARATEEGDTSTLQALNTLERRTELQERLNTRMNEARAIQERLGTLELKIGTQRERGNISELEFMEKLGGARRSAALQLLEIADRFTDIANELKDPAMQAAAERFRAEIDAMAASADILSEKLRTEFKDSATDAISGLFDDLAEGKNVLDSLRKAFSSFADDVIRNINRIAAQSITDALFKGNSGSGGGIGTMFAEFFAGQFGQQIMQGVFASGTDFVPRDGMAYLHRGERVVDAATNRKGGMGVTQNLTFVLSSPVTPHTQNQIASRTLQAANRAVSRGVA